MLELRPNCEYCDKDLPPDATDALGSAATSARFARSVSKKCCRTSARIAAVVSRPGLFGLTLIGGTG